MNSSAPTSVAARLLQRLNLRFPTLVLFLGILTLIDILVPDLIPFVDEIGLALLTLLFGMWKNRKSDAYHDIPGHAEDGDFNR